MYSNIVFHFSGSGNTNILVPLNEKRFEVISEKLSYHDAKEKCNQKGAKLFEPKELYENQFVMNLTKKLEVTDYWIGIHGLGHLHVYSDNTPITWSHFEPLNKPEDPHGCDNDEVCTAVCFCDTMALWKDQCCSMKMHAVCDYQLGKPSLHNFLKLPKHLVLAQKLTPSLFSLTCMFDSFFSLILRNIDRYLLHLL